MDADTRRASRIAARLANTTAGMYSMHARLRLALRLPVSQLASRPTSWRGQRAGSTQQGSRGWGAEILWPQDALLPEQVAALATRACTRLLTGTRTTHVPDIHTHARACTHARLRARVHGTVSHYRQDGAGTCKYDDENK